jgi:hypothetical protein
MNSIITLTDIDSGGAWGFNFNTVISFKATVYDHKKCTRLHNVNGDSDYVYESVDEIMCKLYPKDKFIQMDYSEEHID